eukprot:3670254-Pleurochrysis_carterae.AAC.2
MLLAPQLLFRIGGLLKSANVLAKLPLCLTVATAGTVHGGEGAATHEARSIGVLLDVGKHSTVRSVDVSVGRRVWQGDGLLTLLVLGPLIPLFAATQYGVGALVHGKCSFDGLKVGGHGRRAGNALPIRQVKLLLGDEPIEAAKRIGSVLSQRVGMVGAGPARKRLKCCARLLAATSEVGAPKLGMFKSFPKSLAGAVEIKHGLRWPLAREVVPQRVALV